MSHKEIINVLKPSGVYMKQLKIKFILNSLLILLISMTLKLFAKEIFVHGKVIDYISRDPISGVVVSFRVATTYPTTTSKTDGTFSRKIEIDPAMPELMFTAEKTGYSNGGGRVPNMGDTINVGIIEMRFLDIRTLKLSGIVKDSLTNKPIEGATAYLENNSSGYPVDTSYTDSLGVYLLMHDYDFSYGAVNVYFSVTKEKYYEDYMWLSTKVDSVFNITLMNPVGSIRINTLGRVIDSITQMPISNAMVHLNSNAWDAIPDTTYTNQDGYFSCSVMTGVNYTVAPMINYIITKNDYFNNLGKKTHRIEDTLVDFGDILQQKSSTSISTIEAQFNSVRSKGTITVYSLHGKKLFKGPLHVFKAKMENQGKAGQLYIIRYLKNNSRGVCKKVIFF